jgi:hypothetical protein
MIYSAFRAPLRPSLRTAQDRAADELKLGPELLVNGDFSAGATGWAVNNADATHIATFTGGVLRYQSDTTSPQLNVQQPGVLTVAKKYRVVVEIAAFAGGAIKTDMSAPSTTIGTAPGTYAYTLVAVATNFNLTRSTPNVDITIDRVSVREILQ